MRITAACFVLFIRVVTASTGSTPMWGPVTCPYADRFPAIPRSGIPATFGCWRGLDRYELSPTDLRGGFPGLAGVLRAGPSHCVALLQLAGQVGSFPRRTRPARS